MQSQARGFPILPTTQTIHSAQTTQLYSYDCEDYVVLPPIYYLLEDVLDMINSALHLTSFLQKDILTVAEVIADLEFVNNKKRLRGAQKQVSRTFTFHVISHKICKFFISLSWMFSQFWI